MVAQGSTCAVPVEVSALQSSVWKRAKLGWGAGVRNKGGKVVVGGWEWNSRGIAPQALITVMMQ